LHLRQGSQHLGMPVLVGGQIGTFDAQQVFDGAGDVVAFGDLRGAGDGAFEGLLRGLGVGVEADGDIGGEADAQLGRGRARRGSP
jgi:hypothetical protein